MGKERIAWAPGTMIYPLPAVLVSCGADKKEYNALTVSWVGTICSSPAMCSISVRPERHSYEIIKRTGEFVLNPSPHCRWRAPRPPERYPAAGYSSCGAGC